VEERYTRPQGLYPHPDIDLKKLRRLIVEAKLAPCFPGSDDPRADLEECPICFLVRLRLLLLFFFCRGSMGRHGLIRLLLFLSRL
jgi:hypothetical protein